MTITREALEERLTVLRQERERAIGVVNAYNGAIEEGEYWLSQLSITPIDKELTQVSLKKEVT